MDRYIFRFEFRGALNLPDTTGGSGHGHVCQSEVQMEGRSCRISFYRVFVNNGSFIGRISLEKSSAKIDHCVFGSWVDLLCATERIDGIGQTPISKGLLSVNELRLQVV